ncbi:MAG: hypothetical protein AAGU19_07850 [Prolixibacteraceae bacterium]
MGTFLFVVISALALGLGIALFLQASTNDKLEVENAKLKSANQGLMAETNRLRTQILLGSEKVKARDAIIESLTNGYEEAQKKIAELETALSKLPAKDPKTGKFVSKKPVYAQAEPVKRKITIRKAEPELV